MKAWNWGFRSLGLAGATLAHLTRGRFLWANLLPVTIGNVIGGALLVGAVYWFVYLSTARPRVLPAPAIYACPVTVRAMVLEKQGMPLQVAHLPRPDMGAGQVRLRVNACGVCRTDLHIRDGELPNPKLPLVLGHEIVGTVIEGGDILAEGLRVGVPWLGWTCGECRYCRSGRCDRELEFARAADSGGRRS